MGAVKIKETIHIRNTRKRGMKITQLSNEVITKTDTLYSIVSETEHQKLHQYISSVSYKRIIPFHGHVTNNIYRRKTAES